MAKRIRRIRVTIPAHRTLRIYDPHGPAKPTITGLAVLPGELERIDGLTWAIFPTQRGYGLPIRAPEGSPIEIDLKLAAYYSGVTYELIKTRVEETI